MFKTELIAKSFPFSLIVEPENIQDNNAKVDEEYLLELLNNSIYFLSKFNGKKFKPIIFQSNGESDAFCDDYKIDFKRFESQKFFQMIREKGLRYSDYGNSSVVIKPRNINKAINYKSIFTYAVESNNINIEIDTEYTWIRKLLSTKKNLLLLYPYIFSKRNLRDEEITAIDVRNELYDVFFNFFEYRNKQCPNFDTFFVFIFDDNFCLFKLEDNILKLIEQISCRNVSTFMNKLSKVYFWINFEDIEKIFDFSDIGGNI